jgi:hypothetical protein
VTKATWLHSRRASAVKAVVALGLAYIAGSRAIDTGSYWEYLAFVVLFILGIKFIVHLFKRHGSKD